MTETTTQQNIAMMRMFLLIFQARDQSFGLPDSMYQLTIYWIKVDDGKIYFYKSGQLCWRFTPSDSRTLLYTLNNAIRFILVSFSKIIYLLKTNKKSFKALNGVIFYIFIEFNIMQYLFYITRISHKILVKNLM